MNCPICKKQSCRNTLCRKAIACIKREHAIWAQYNTLDQQRRFKNPPWKRDALNKECLRLSQSALMCWHDLKEILGPIKASRLTQYFNTPKTNNPPAK